MLMINEDFFCFRLISPPPQKPSIDTLKIDFHRMESANVSQKENVLSAYKEEETTRSEISPWQTAFMGGGKNDQKARL